MSKIKVGVGDEFPVAEGERPPGESRHGCRGWRDRGASRTSNGRCGRRDETAKDPSQPGEAGAKDRNGRTP